MTRHQRQPSTFYLIWLLTYISIASVSAAIITPALPQIQLDYHVSLGTVEWIVSTFLIGYVGGQLIYAPLANRYGRLKALRMGLALNIIGIVICLIAVAMRHFGVLILGRLITALGAASGLSCTFMLINEWLPESQRKGAMAYSTLSFALGIGLSVFFGGLITEYWAWQGCFWILLGHGLIMLWGTCVFSETIQIAKPIDFKTIFHGYLSALSSYKLVVFSIVVGYCSTIAYCFSAAAPQIAQTLLHLSAAEYGYWNILNILGMLLGGLFAKQILMRTNAFFVIVLGLIGVAIGITNLGLMWLLHNSSALWFFLVTMILYIFSGLLFSGGSMVASNAIDDKANGAAMMSFVNMFFATSNVILMGYLAKNPLLGFFTILAMVWFLIVLLLSFNRR